MTIQRILAKRRDEPATKDEQASGDLEAMARPGARVMTPSGVDAEANGAPARGLEGAAGDRHAPHGGCSARGDRGLHGNQTLLRLLERARAQRGSPSLWDAVADRLDAEERQRDVVAPMLELLHEIQARVDDDTWGLVLDFEARFSSEVMAGVEVGLELGYEHGRAAALLDVERVPGNAARVLTGRLADLLGDTEAEYLEVVLALVATIEATVRMAHGHGGGTAPRRRCGLAGDALR